MLRKVKEKQTFRDLCSIYKKRDEIRDDIICAIDTKTDAALGYYVLSKNAEKKENLFKDVYVKCQMLSTFIWETSVRRSLNRRVNQMDCEQGHVFGRYV